MQGDNKYMSLRTAIQNCGNNQRVVDLGIDRGFKIIDEED